MVNPIKNRSQNLPAASGKKKSPKEVDQRVNKAIKKVKLPLLDKGNQAERASYAARQKRLESQKAALKAQKSDFVARRAHMTQQSAAAKRAIAAEKAKKEAQEAAKKAARARRIKKIKVYVGRPGEKKYSGIVKKYIPSALKKKK